MHKIGWISLNREIINHWVFDDAEYFKAWVCILLEVNHEPNSFVIKKKTLECGRGESLKSLDTWGSMFGSWSKGKVNRFFKLLEKHDMITLKNERITTRLSVCNYTTYQNNRNADDTADGTQTERRRTTNNKGNNEDNENKFDEFWEAYGKKVSVGSAKKAWKKIDQSDYGQVILAAGEAAANYTGDPKFRPHGSSWLNAEGWRDESSGSNQRGGLKVESTDLSAFGL